MTVNVGDLEIKVRLNMSEFNTGIGGVKGGLGGLSMTVMGINQALELMAKAWNVAAGAAKSLTDAGTKIQTLNNTFKVVSGSVGGASQEIDYLRDTSNKLGLEFASTTQAYKGLAAAARGTSLEGKQTREIFEAVSGASAVLGLSAQDTSGMLLALQQMLSKGKVSAEELRQQLGERLPGASRLAADAMGMTTQQFEKQMASGKVLAEDFLPKMAAKIKEVYAAQAELAANTSFVAGMNRLSNSWLELKQNAADNSFMSGSTNVLKELSNAMKDPDTVEAAKQIGLVMADLLKILAENIPPAANATKEAIIEVRNVLSDTKAAVVEISKSMKDWIDEIFNSEVVKKILSFKDTLGGLIDKFKEWRSERDYLNEDAIPGSERQEEGDAQRAYRVNKEMRELYAKMYGTRTGTEKDNGELMGPNWGKPTPQKQKPLPDTKGQGAVESAIDNLRKKIADLKGDIAGAELTPFAKAFEKAKADVEEINIQLRKAREKGLMSGELEKLFNEFKKLRIEAVDGEFFGKLADKTREFDQAAKAVDLSPMQQELAQVMQEVAGLNLESEKAIEATNRLKDALNKKYAAQFRKENMNAMFSNRMAGFGMSSMASDFIALGEQGQGLTGEARAQWFNKVMGKSTDVANAKTGPASWFNSSSFSLGLEEAVKQLKVTSEEADKFKASMTRAFDLSNVSSAVQDFADIISGPLTEAMVEMATTGKVNFAEIGKAVIKGIMQYASGKAIQLGVTAAYEGIMALVDTDNKIDGGNHAVKATAALKGAAIMSAFAAGSGLAHGLAGMAHEGLSSIPDDGTWLLKKGERVVNDKDNAALSNMVNNWRDGKRVVVNMPVTINGGDEEGVKKSLPKMKQAIIEAVTADIANNGAIRKTIQSYT